MREAVPIRKRELGFLVLEFLMTTAVLAVIAAVALPNLTLARAKANEASAISNLRTLVSVQQVFRDLDLDGDAQDDYAADLQELEDASLIDTLLGGGEKAGYVFVLSSTTVPEPAWSATASPADEDAGRRCFYVDQTGEIRVGPPCPADANNLTLDEAGEPETASDKNVVKLLKRFLPPAILDAILAGLDTNQDEALSFDEVLAADPLALARDVIQQLYPNTPGGGYVASDTHLDAITQEYLDTVETDLQLGIANEDVPALPTVPLKVLSRGKALKVPW